jgi:hypothetical protein
LIAWICWLLTVGMAFFGSLGGQECTVMIIVLGVFAHFFDNLYW